MDAAHCDVVCRQGAICIRIGGAQHLRIVTAYA
jgi:hypothetical protein